MERSFRGHARAFLQITHKDTVDLAIPGHSYTFATVKEAQAGGDFDALAKHQRRARWILLHGALAGCLCALREPIERAFPGGHRPDESEKIPR